MITVRMSEDSYVVIRTILANTLEAEMLRGHVVEWDGELELVLGALLDLSIRAS